MTLVETLRYIDGMNTTQQALAFLRQRHHGEHLVDELIADRRTAAHLEDVELERTPGHERHSILRGANPSQSFRSGRK